MDTNIDLNLPAQGLRSPRTRRLGSTVPAPSPSSSNDGLSTVCPAGTVDENAPAKVRTTVEGKDASTRTGTVGVLTRSVKLSRPEIGTNSSSPADPGAGKKKKRGPPGGGENNEEEDSPSDATIASLDDNVPMSTASSDDSLLIMDPDNTEWSKVSGKRKRPAPKGDSLPRRKEPPTTSGSTNRREAKAEEDVRDLLEEYKSAPIPDLGAVILEEMSNVWRVSKVSRGLKGELSGTLKKASCRTKAAVQALISKVPPTTTTKSREEWPALPVKGKEEEQNHLRRELEVAQARIKRMERELADLRGLAKSGNEMETEDHAMRSHPPSPSPPLPPSPPLQPKAKRARRGEATGGRRIIRDSSSSEEDTRPSRGRKKEEEPINTKENDDSPRRPSLPPRGEWPPALRPPLKGERKLLDISPARVAWPKGRKEVEPGKMEDRLMAKITDMFRSWTISAMREIKKEISSPPKTPNGGQENCGGKEPQPLLPQTMPKGKGKGESKPKGKDRDVRKPVGKETTSGGDNPSGPQSSSPPTRPPTWVEVLGSKEKKKRRKKTSTAASPNAPGADRPQKGGKKRVRAPKRAAVVVTCPEGQYAECLRLARDNIDLASLSIESIRPKRALTGALILEVPGPNSEANADKLATRMRETLAHKEGTRISRPKKMGELRLKGMDESITKDEAMEAVSRIGECPREDIQVGELTRNRAGLYTIWLKCPVATAKKLADLGHLRIGWSRVGVEALEARPLQCFRCFGRGHVRAQCPSNEDRTGACYRCGLSGHVARGCQNPPQCLLCKEAGRAANHRMGGKACKAPPPKKRTSGKDGSERRTAVKTTGTYNGPPAPPPCAMEGPKQPPQWDYVVPPPPCAERGNEEETKERRPPGPRIVAMEVVAPPRRARKDKEKEGLEEPMELETTNDD